MKRIAIASAVVGLATACGGGSGEETSGGGDAASDRFAAPLVESGARSTGAYADAEVANAADAADPCADAGVPPTTLACTGLYSDFATLTLSPNAQPYAPAVPLWSDGATKERWIELPPGQQIDVSDPNEWTFPVGTKLFKQFTYEGVRVETRMFQKIDANPSFWVYATYAWNTELTEATINYGSPVPVGDDGGTWVIPTNDDCLYCHEGRQDRILGFEQVSLGLSGATGLTLLQLVVNNLVTPAPTQVNLFIGDDGTGLDGPALSWLHINCGVTCHNSNQSAQAYAAGMLLRLDPTQLNGSPATTTSWNDLSTTINVPCVSGSVAGIPRIEPGDPDASAIVQLISERGLLQMPPIASRFVDTTDVASVVAWISHMPGVDAGVEAGPVADAASESGSSGPDATVPADASDSTTPDALQTTPDATSTPDVVSSPDAEEDGGEPDAGEIAAEAGEDGGYSDDANDGGAD